MLNFYSRWHAVLAANWRILGSALAALLLGCAAWAASLFWPTATPDVADPGRHQKVSAAAAELRMLLPADLAASEIKKNLTLPAGVAGKLAVAGRLVTFRPAAPLPAGQTLAFSLDRASETQSGRPLGKDLAYTFAVVGLAKLAATTPARDAVEVPPEAALTLTWDRPVATLATALAGRAPIPAVKISPKVAGKWRWLGTSTLRFDADAPLPLGTEFTVRVPAGIPVVNGETTGAVESFQFRTATPHVTEIALANDPPFWQDVLTVGEGTPVVVRFSQPVDLPSLREKLEIRKSWDDSPVIAAKLPALPPPAVAPFYDEIDGKKELDTAAALLTFPPGLPAGSDLTLIFGAGIRAAGGALGTPDAHLERLRAAAPLAVTTSTDGQKTAPPRDCLRLFFSSPVRGEDLKKVVTLSPAPADFLPANWSLEEWVSDVQVSCQLAPATNYTVAVASGVADFYGQKLAAKFERKFVTADLPPAISIGNEKGQFVVAERSHPPVVNLKTVNVAATKLALYRVELADYFAVRGQAAELKLPNAPVKTWQIPAKNSAKNAWSIHEFDVQKELGSALGSGIYVLTARAPEYTLGAAYGETDAKTKNTPVVERQFFTVTDLGITLKYSRGSVLAWVTDLQTGAPVADAVVTLRTRDGAIPASGQTDASGFFTAEVDLQKLQSGDDSVWNRPEFWVTAEKNGDTAFLGSNWNRGLQPWDFGLPDAFNGTDKPYRLESQIYTERALYRPGDTVHLKGLLRLRDDRGALLVPPKKWQAEVVFRDGEWNEIATQKVTLSKYGSFATDLPLAREVALGDWQATVQLVPDEAIAGNYATAWFAVKEYRKPEYKVELSSDRAEYFSGDKAAVKVAGSYFFGAPLASAQVSYRATATDYFFNRGPTDEWYSFALNDAWCAADCTRGAGVLAEKKTVLGGDGKLAFDLPLDLTAKPVSQVVTVEADVSDANNQTTSGRTEFVVHKTDIYTGVKVDSSVVAPRSNAAVDVITLAPDGSPAPQKKVTVQLFARTWQTVKKKSVDGEYYFDNTPTDKFLRDATVTTGKDGRGRVNVKVDGGGEYRVVATAADSAGRESKAGTSIYAWDDAYVSWSHKNSDRLEIIADKTEYRVGDTAHLLVQAPWAGDGVRALVTVEREGIISKKIVDIKSTGQKIDVPVIDDFTPNAYVSVVLVKPRQGETFDKDNRDTGVPAFRMGYAKIAVNVDHKKLAVTLTTDKQKYAPGETVHAKIVAKDSSGKPVQAEFSLGVVDMSLLALTGFQLPNLVENFYHERGLEVATSEMLQYLLERYKPGTKGGGGSDPETKKRGNFKDTAYWNPNLITDSSGVATADFALPDNLTTWQLLALGSTEGSRFGAVAHEIVETKRVLLRPVRPRFAVAGDRATLGAIVHNYLDAETEFAVTLSGSGFTFAAKDAATQTVRIPAGESRKVNFAVTFAAGENATLNFRAEAAGARDEIEEKIPVYRFGAPETAATTLVTDGANVDGEIYLPSKAEMADGTLTVAATPTLATFFPAALDYLTHFEYLCTEQLVSATLPRVLASRLPGSLGASAGTPAELQKIVTQNLATLYTRQKSDGGFGYWPESDRSDPALSAYVALALTKIASAGFAVDSGVQTRARDYLKATLGDAKLPPALQTELLFALAESGHREPARVAALFGKRHELPLAARAELAMLLAKLDDETQQKQAREVWRDLTGHAKVTARELHFEEPENQNYNSPLVTRDRTQALILLAFTRLEPDSKLLPQFVRYLTFHRDGGHWDSTQSTAWMLAAFAEYLAKTGEGATDFAATVRLSGAPILSGKFKAGALTTASKTLDLAALASGQLAPFEIAQTAAGKLYVDFLLTYFATGETLPAVDEGFTVTREITPVGDAPKAPTVGATYRVKLTVTTPDMRRIVAVESPLPAGFEAIDTSFANTSQAEARATETGRCATDWTAECSANENWRFRHTELRDDRVLLFADELPAGAYTYEYLVRATTPGNFRLRPARAWEMYFPETYGQTTGERFTILDAQ